MKLFSFKKKKPEAFRVNLDKRLLSTKDVPYQQIEAFRALRTNVMYSNIDSDSSVIGVLSSLAGSGKSFVMANLAISLSQLIDKRVLLIDGDLRCPTVHKIFLQDNKKGLSSYLAGLSQSADELLHHNNDQLDILTSGVIPPNPIELLSSERMKKLIENMRGKYDYILLDLPPIGEVADAMAVTSFVSGFIFVVRSGCAEKSLVAESIEMMRQKNAKIYGFVLSDVERKHLGLEKYYYHTKYSRYSKYSVYSPYLQKTGDEKKP